MTLRINDNGVDRDMTADEIAAYKIDAVEVNKVMQDLEDQKALKQQAIESAIAKLTALGLTVDDLKALGL
jgi:hypothetical protein